MMLGCVSWIAGAVFGGYWRGTGSLSVGSAANVGTLFDLLGRESSCDGICTLYMSIPSSSRTTSRSGTALCTYGGTTKVRTLLLWRERFDMIMPAPLMADENSLKGSPLNTNTYSEGGKDFPLVIRRSPAVHHLSWNNDGRHEERRRLGRCERRLV